MDETWRPVPGFIGYEASDHGRLRSVDRVANGRCYRGRILKTPAGSAGYPKAQLGRGNHVHVHQAVLLAFVGPPQPGMECRHLDGDRSNSALSNLCWGTASENGYDRERHGTGISGEANPNIKLSDVEVISIRRLRSKGWKLKEIADRFDVTPANISYICRGETRNG